MRVLHLRSSLGFYGAEALIEALALGQRRRGDEVAVACLVDARAPHTELLERLRGGPVEAVAVPSEGRLARGVPGRVARLLRERGAEVLHTHDYKTAVLGWAAAKLAKVPVVATFHGEVADDARVRAYEAAARAVLRGYDGVALVSRAQEGRFADGWRRRSPVFVPNAVDAAGLAAAAAAARASGEASRWLGGLGVPEGAFVVGTVGRLCADKGQLEALEAVARVMGRHPRVYWVLAGEGPQRGEIEAAVAARGLSGRVVVAGFVEAMARLYASLELLLHPSRREGLPMVLLEAMACGVPALASPVGEIPGVLGEGGGVLLGDRGAALEGALEAMLGDEAARAAKGRAAAAVVARGYSVERLAARYEAALYLPALRRG